MITVTNSPTVDETFKNNLTTSDVNHLEKDAWEFIKSIVKAQKLMRKQFGTIENAHIHLLGLSNRIQITNLEYLCKLLHFNYVREDWDGNEVCDSDNDIIYFMYKGYKFFELVDKEKSDEGK